MARRIWLSSQGDWAIFLGRSCIEASDNLDRELEKRTMFYRRFISYLTAIVITLTALAAASAGGSTDATDRRNNRKNTVQVSEPLNLAVKYEINLR